ncbi:MAG TPA: YibE/F family protein [Candidatus Limnocylindrales bacterium]|nr:YibE/F family protein [Candidatus Limnocylindrales bacterium]
MTDRRHRAADTATEPVPFAGLRRHAPAIAGGLIILVAIWLVPDLTPPSSVAPPVVLVHARVTDLLPASDEPGRPDARVVVLEGPNTGDEMDAHIQGPSGQQDVPRYEVGDEVIVNVSQQGEDEDFVAVADRYRIPPLALLLGVFAVAVTLVGGWRGVRSLLALVLTLGIIIRIVVPLLLAGWDPVPLAVVSATIVTIITFLLTEGVRPTTVAAAAGTFLALALTSLLAVAFNGLAQFTELQGSPDLVFLQTAGRAELDLGGLLLAAVIFGALGILDDVTVTQAATVHELHDADPRANRTALFWRAMNVGRSHISATVNTLALAYVGASLPLIVLLNAGQQEPLLIASGEVVAVEIVKAVVGSIGIVAAVPATTAMAVLLVGRPWAFLDRQQKPPGWD